jgi:hypothetical protein
MAGTAAGATAAAQSAVLGAYTGLRDVLRRVLTQHGGSDEVLDAVEAEPGTWQTDLGEALTEARADQDAEVLAAAQALLAAADPAGAALGNYTLDASRATSVQVGDQTVHVGVNYGATAGTMSAPVGISYGQVPNPPAQPGA